MRFVISGKRTRKYGTVIMNIIKNKDSSRLEKDDDDPVITTHKNVALRRYSSLYFQFDKVILQFLIEKYVIIFIFIYFLKFIVERKMDPSVIMEMSCLPTRSLQIREKVTCSFVCSSSIALS